MIRLATERDIPAISEIYEDIHTAEERGETVIGWKRGVYPTAASARAAYEAGDLYVLERDGKVLAAGRINEVQMPAYASVNWLYPAKDSEVLVLHVLTVSPKYAGQGCAREFIDYYDALARERGCRVLRIDTNMKNARARRLYSYLGFREAGIVPCDFNGLPNIELVCLERPVK